MNKILTATALGVALTFSLPALAEDSAACVASWTKMDTSNRGFVMAADHRAMMDKMMKDAKYKSSAEDRMTRQEYMNACIAGLFNTSP